MMLVRLKVKIALILTFTFISGIFLFAKDSNQITITVTSFGSPGHFKFTNKVVQEYMKIHPNIKVNVYKLPQEANEQYGIYLQAFEAKSSDLDVLCVDGIWPGDLAGNLIDLNKFDAGKHTNGMFKSLVEGGTVNGHLVAMPWYASCPALYYRKDLLKKYNLEVPETWKDLAKAAYVIQKGERKTNPDFVGYVWAAEAFEGLTCAALEWLDSNGAGTIVSMDKKITVDSPKAVKVMQMVKSWIGTICPVGITGMDDENVRHVFQGGNAAFMRNWQYAYLLAEGKDSPIRGKVGLCPMPKGDAGISANTSGASYLAVNKYSKHPKDAADFIYFMTSSKVQKQKALATGHCPTVKSLYTNKEILKKNAAFKVFSVILQHLVNRPAIQTSPHYNQVSKIFYKAVYNILTGQNSAESALASAAREIQDITKYPILK